MFILTLTQLVPLLSHPLPHPTKKVFLFVIITWVPFFESGWVWTHPNPPETPPLVNPNVSIVQLINKFTFNYSQQSSQASVAYDVRCYSYHCIAYTTHWPPTVVRSIQWRQLEGLGAVAPQDSPNNFLIGFIDSMFNICTCICMYVCI